MSDTRTLLQQFLQKIFQDRLAIVDETFYMIEAFNSGNKSKEGYVQTLKIICERMCHALPPEILVYLLSLVQAPSDQDCQLPIMKKLLKTQSCLPESIKKQLTNLLEAQEPSCSSRKEESNKMVQSSSPKEADTARIVKKPVKRRTRKVATKNSSPVKNSSKVSSLQDLAASYVVRNERSLNSFYNKKLALGWKRIKSNVYSGEDLKKCYEAVEDVNRKRALLRCVEDNEIPEKLLREEWKGSTDIFLKEQRVYELVRDDPFVPSEKLLQAIDKFLE